MPLGFAVVDVVNAHLFLVVARLAHPTLFTPVVSVAMSDLCPVYAPFFGAMVRRLVSSAIRVVLKQHVRVAPAPSCSLVSISQNAGGIRESRTYRLGTTFGIGIGAR